MSDGYPEGFVYSGDRAWVVAEPITHSVRHLGADITITVVADGLRPAVASVSIEGGPLTALEIQRLPWGQLIESALRAGASRWSHARSAS